jgi:P2 family phage contractile tail tube protein
MLHDVIKLLQFSLADNTYVGRGTFKEPSIAFKTEADENSYIGIDQITGLNALSAEISLSGFSPEALKLVGLCSGKTKRLIGMASFDTPNCEASSYKVIIEGVLTEVPGAEIKPGRFEKRTFKVGSIRYYKLEIGGSLIYEIDRNNHIVIVNGVDLMAPHRANAGL